MSRAVTEASCATPTLQERKQQLVRSAIRDAAMDLFAAKGWDETTVDEIADRAGISRRSFFRYFSSKNDLMASAAVDYADILAQAIHTCPRGTGVAQVVRHMVLQVAQQCAANPRTRKVMRILTKHPAAREALGSQRLVLRERVAAELSSRGGAFRGLATGVLSDLILAALDSAFHLWFQEERQDIRTAAEEVLSTLGRMA